MRGGLRAKTLKKHTTDSIKYLTLLKKYVKLKNQCSKCEFGKSNKSASSPIQAWTEESKYVTRTRSAPIITRMTPKTKHAYRINKYYREICNYHNDVDKFLLKYDPDSEFLDGILSKLKANNAINAFDVRFNVNGQPVRFNEACKNLEKQGEIIKIEQRKIAYNPLERLKGTEPAKKSDSSPIPLKPGQPLQEGSVAERSSPNNQKPSMPRFDESALIQYYELVQTIFENMMNYLMTSDSICVTVNAQNNCDLLKQSIRLLMDEIKDKLRLYSTISKSAKSTSNQEVIKATRSMTTYLNNMKDLLESLDKSVLIQQTRSRTRSVRKIDSKNADAAKILSNSRRSVAFDIPPPIRRSQSAK